METGLYIKSKKLPPAAAVLTRPCSLKDSTTSPFWNQELIIDAFYSDVVSEDSLLLFEVLDDKPSLNVNRRHQQANDGQSSSPTAKRIAWAYLLPIGVSGDLNVGLSDDWKTSKRIAAKSTPTSSPTKGTAPGAQGVTFESPPRDSPRQGDTEQDREHTESADNEGTLKDDVRGSANSAAHRRNYPWSKQSADMPVRLQLHYYRQYDGVIGFLQRKIMGWPTLGNYADR